MESRTRWGLHFLPVSRKAVVEKSLCTDCCVIGAPFCLWQRGWRQEHEASRHAQLGRRLLAALCMEPRPPANRSPGGSPQQPKARTHWEKRKLWVGLSSARHLPMNASSSADPGRQPKFGKKLETAAMQSAKATEGCRFMHGDSTGGWMCKAW